LRPCPSSWTWGAKAYADYGMGRSRGTMPIQLAGNVKRGGLFELAFGMTLGEIIDDIGGGTHGPAGQGGAGRRPARRLFPARCSTRRSTTRPSPP
jgi:NADH:ubiquinone oxidoreductase subunit F (NADH-binding)